jgi:fused signal recognition particle receptor
MIKWFRRKDKSAAEPKKDYSVTEIPEDEPAVEPHEDRAVDALDEGGTVQEDPIETIAAAVESGPTESEIEPELAAGVTTDLEVPIPAEQRKGRFFKRLKERLKKTREQFANRVDRLVSGKKTIDQELLDDLEEVLITSDLGVRTTQLLLRKIAEKIDRQELKDPNKLRDQLREEIRNILTVEGPPWDPRTAHPFVIMVIGVNGVGKTTTIGKLAHQLKQEGLDVMLVAGDTFRAAAIEQLTLWGDRVSVPVVRQKSGSDPSAVAFDALDAAVARNADVVILDTAGRMHTKVNLMEELKKVQRTINKKMELAPHEVLLILDSTTGQNALSQARLFKEGIGITGLVLTKLDGTAKGGIIVSICDELKVPVRYIGIGEDLEDLRPFDPEEFTNALF